MKIWQWVLIGIGAGIIVGVAAFTIGASGTVSRSDRSGQSARSDQTDPTEQTDQTEQTAKTITPSSGSLPASATGTVSNTVNDQPSTSILFLGDIMLDRTVRTRMAKSKADNFPFDQIGGPGVGVFAGQDLVVANLEGPVTAVRRPPEKSIDFAFDPSVVPLLKRVGINAVSQANNHSLDQGRVGADESRAYLTKGGIAVFGDQVKDEAAYSMTVLSVHGQNVALLGFNDSDRRVDQEKAAAAIKEAKTKADRVIVMVHWGTEYQAKPNARQTDLAHWFIDQGVDAVIGGHPHWMESVEQYHDRFIAYSLGNFVFDQDWSAETREGLAVKLVLASTSTEAYLYPVHIEKSEPSFLTGAARTARLNRLASISDPAMHDGIVGGMIRIGL